MYFDQGLKGKGLLHVKFKVPAGSDDDTAAVLVAHDAFLVDTDQQLADGERLCSVDSDLSDGLTRGLEAQGVNVLGFVRV